MTLAHMGRFNPGALFTGDRFSITGDSLTTFGGEDGQVEAVPDKRAWNIFANSDTGLQIVRPLDERYAIGGNSPWYYMGDEYYRLTGRTSMWAAYGKAATSITKTANPASHLDYSDRSYDSVTNTGHRLFDRDGSILSETEHLIASCYGFTTHDHFLIFAGGAFDASALRLGMITQQQITDALIGAYDWWAANHGVTKMLIIKSGLIGDTQMAVDADQANPAGRDMLGLRAAQTAACDHPNIYMLYDHADSPGDPFNTIEADPVTGYWVNGSNRDDVGGVHPSGAMNAIVGRTAAWNLAVMMGYVAGELI